MDRSRRIAFITPYYLWFLFLVLCPFLLVLVTSFFRRNELGVVVPDFTFDSYKQLFDPLYFEILSRTLFMAIANTIATMLVSYPLAFYISRLQKNKAAWAITLIMIPFWTNFLIRILAFMDVLRLKPFGFDLVYTAPGILAALVYNYLPFAVLPLYSTCKKIDHSVIEAAFDLSASRLQILTKVLWPLTRNGVITASLLVYVPTLGEFLIPEIVGGGKHFFLGTFLQQQFMVSRNWPLGSAAIILLILFAICFVLLEQIITRGANEKPA